MWHASSDPPPTFTSRERLHQNIARLQSLDRQLFSDPRKQLELLTAIELVGFKVRHLARQIQDAEHLHSTAPLSESTAHSPAPVC